MAEEIKEIKKQATEFFSEQRLPFTFDLEDYQHYKINAEIKKMVTYMHITLPIVHLKGTNEYLVGGTIVFLELKGAFVHVREA